MLDFNHIIDEHERYRFVELASLVKNNAPAFQKFMGHL